MKNYHTGYLYNRNWCWIGLKNKCHGNLKEHYSWATLQDMAAKEGHVPPRSFEPFSPVAFPQLCDKPSNGATRNWTLGQRATASEWFRDNVKVYVLNLASDKERWRMFSGRLSELYIPVTRVAGVDMREPGALEGAKLAGWVPQGFNFTRAQAKAYDIKQDMGSIRGTLGCASAHFKAQAQVLADGAPLAVVFEDDSYIVDDFVERLWSLVTEELPCDWEVTALMSRCPYGRCVSQHLLRVRPDANEPAYGCRHGVNWGMHGILYRTSELARVQRKWKPTVFDEERPRCMDVDVALASISDHVNFYAVPSVQEPGFLKEMNYRSARWHINVVSASTRTTTTTQATCAFYGCFGAVRDGAACQCTANCVQFHNCCKDYDQKCSRKR